MLYKSNTLAYAGYCPIEDPESRLPEEPVGRSVPCAETLFADGWHSGDSHDLQMEYALSKRDADYLCDELAVLEEERM